MEDDFKAYPNAINPNAHSRGNLAIQRAMLAMSLAQEDSPEAKQIQAELLDQEGYQPKTTKTDQ